MNSGQKRVEGYRGGGFGERTRIRVGERKKGYWRRRGRYIKQQRKGIVEDRLKEHRRVL